MNTEAAETSKNRAAQTVGEVVDGSPLEALLVVAREVCATHPADTKLGAMARAAIAMHRARRGLDVDVAKDSSEVDQ